MRLSVQCFGILASLAGVTGVSATASAQTAPAAPAASPTPAPAAAATVSAEVAAPAAAPEAPAVEAPAPAPTPVVAAAPAPEVIAPVTPAPIADVPPPAPTAGFDKSFFIQSEDGANRLEVGGRVQPRYTYEAIEKADNKGYFSVNRAEVRLSGNLFTKDLAFKFEADFGQGSVALKDFYGDYAFIPNGLHLRFGQFKKPISRTGITSAGSLETTQRALADGAWGAGRDQGIMLHNNYDKSPTIEWALGLFNGVGERPWFTGAVNSTVTGTADANGDVTGTATGTVAKDARSTIVPANYKPSLVARVGFNHGDIKGYSEADLEGGPFRLGVAASGAIDFDTDGGNDSEVRGEIDTMLKVEGFSLTGGYYVASKQAGAGFGDRAFGRNAFYAQVGYVILGKVQPVVRFGMLNPAKGKNNDTELVGGISFYPYKHGLKWQNDVGTIWHQATDTKDIVFRSQVQIGF